MIRCKAKKTQRDSATILHSARYFLNQPQPDYAAIIRDVRPLTQQEPHRIEALTILAKAYTAIEQHALAYESWLSVAEGKGDALSWWQTACAAARVQRNGLAHDHFAQALDLLTPNPQAQQTEAVYRYRFARALVVGRASADALTHLTWLRDLYAELQIVGRDHLFLRGIPDFFEVLSFTVTVLEAAEWDVTVWLKPLYDHLLDGEGLAYLDTLPRNKS